MKGLDNLVAIEPITRDAAVVARAIGTAVEAVGRAPRGKERWVVKLNLTYPTYLPGVVNSPLFVEGLCRWAREAGIEVWFVEGDGGNGSYAAEDTFAGNGITSIAERYGMRCQSVSEKPWQWRETRVDDRTVRLPYSPLLLRREFDCFVTAPVLKNHTFTIATLGMKNLWGCIPDAYRMYYHHELDHGIVALAMELRPDFTILDGIVSLRGRGPIDGYPVDTNFVMVGRDVGATEAAGLKLMSKSIADVTHLSIAHALGIVPAIDQLRWQGDPTPFVRDDFIVERSLLNRVSMLLAQSPRLQRLVYHSPVSGAIYAVVNLLRPRSASAALAADRRANRYTTIDLDHRR